MLTLLSLIGENHNKQKYFDSETAIIPPPTHTNFLYFLHYLYNFFYHHNLIL